MSRRGLIGTITALALLVGAGGLPSAIADKGASAASSLPQGAATTSARPAGGVLLPPDDLGQRPMTEEEIMAMDEESSRTGVPAWWVAFGMAVDKVRAEYPKDFGAAVVNPDQRSGTVWFVGAVPEGVSDRFESIGGVALRSDYGVQEAVYQQFASDLHLELMEQLGDLSTFSTYADDARRVIVVEYGRTAKGAPVAESTVRRMEQITALLPAPAGFVIEFVAVDAALLLAPELFHGARELANVCTGAFPVRRKGGNELGILTAAHCPGTGPYDGTANAFYSPYPYSISTEAGSGGGDFRWNHSKYGLSGRTFIDPDEPLRVYSTAVPGSKAGIPCACTERRRARRGAGPLLPVG